MVIRGLRASWSCGFRRFLYPIVLVAGLFVAFPSDAQDRGTLTCYETYRDCLGGLCNDTFGVYNGRVTVMYSTCCWTQRGSVIPSCYTSRGRFCAPRCYW